MIFSFSNKPKQEKDKLIGESYFFVQECAAKGIDIEIVEVVKKRSMKQNAGYWRICTLLIPYLQKSHGEVFDKDLISDLVKLSAGYSYKVGKQVVPKSLTKATQDQMNILIEKLYEICEHFGLKNYQLSNEEQRAMVEHYEKLKKGE